MSYCTSCGSSIPDGQGSSCSMCYGDPYHGRDGYYLQELERDAEMKEAQRIEKLSAALAKGENTVNPIN